jgi:DnaK suppressor protein
MESYNHSMAARFTQLLAEREAELRAILRASGDSDGQVLDAEPREVTDFKDVAEEESLAVVDDAKAGRAVQELEQVLAARHRLLDGNYGDCLNCGEAIDLRRLTALPATPFCTACQAAHEREHKAPTHR